jgi:hypothetical protein
MNKTKHRRLITRLHKEAMANRLSLAVDIFRMQKNNPTLASRFKWIAKKIDGINSQVIDKKAAIG